MRCVRGGESLPIWTIPLERGYCRTRRILFFPKLGYRAKFSCSKSDSLKANRFSLSTMNSWYEYLQEFLKVYFGDQEQRAVTNITSCIVEDAKWPNYHHFTARRYA